MLETTVSSIPREIDFPLQTRWPLDRPIHVLLIEDNPEQAEWTAMALNDGAAGERFDVEWVSSLLAGMSRLRDRGCDVVLLDLGLPELDGHGSHTAIRIADSKVPVVILTSDQDPGTRRLIMEGGACEYLLKPETDAGALRLAVTRAMGSRPERPS
ncbi:MAG: response regulator [Bryobacteraceae bacterium]